jgi:hypothetical protein
LPVSFDLRSVHLSLLIQDITFVSSEAKLRFPLRICDRYFAFSDGGAGLRTAPAVEIEESDRLIQRARNDIAESSLELKRSRAKNQVFMTIWQRRCKADFTPLAFALDRLPLEHNE